MEVIIVKALLGIIFGGVVLAFLQYERLSARLTGKRYYVLMGWVATRLLPFAGYKRILSVG
jgi:hypothetical protein